MKKVIKSKSILPLPIALVSFEIYLGMIFGYFLAKFLSGKKTGEPGINKSLILNIGKLRIHLHHWLIGLGILIFSFFYYLIPITQFSFGFLTGVIFQGIYCYSDWSKIFIKRCP